MIRTHVAFEVEERGLVADRSVDPDLREQLRAAAATVRPRAGETTTVRLELTRLPSAAEASVSLSRRAWRESGTAAARRNANTDKRGGTRWLARCLLPSTHH